MTKQYGHIRPRTFLTGASGYIGLHILQELLTAGHHVTAVVRSPRKLGPLGLNPRLRVVEADLEDQACMDDLLVGHEVCIHAALIWGAPGSELEVRDVATAAKLFDSSARVGLKRCIYISSVAVHRPFSGAMSERDGLSVTDLYGATKAAGELFLRATCAASPMIGVVVRPGPVVGPPAFAEGSFRSDRRIAEMVAAARENRPILTPPEYGRQFTDVYALARAIRLLTTLEAPFPTYVCVDKEITTWGQIAQTVVEKLKSASEVRVQSLEVPGPVPCFRTDAVDKLNGRPMSSRAALLKHILHLSQSFDGR